MKTYNILCTRIHVSQIILYTLFIMHCVVLGIVATKHATFRKGTVTCVC